MDFVKFAFVVLCCLQQSYAFLTDNDYDECSSISFVTAESGHCVHLLNMVNRIVGHTHDDICRAYNEVARCIQLRAEKINSKCSLTALHDSFIKTASYSSRNRWILNLNLNTCTLSQFTGSICSSPERIGHVIGEACLKPVLSGFSSSHTTNICPSVTGLDGCAGSFLRSLGENCTVAEINLGLQSETASDWVRSHYPSMNLNECFAVYHVGQTGHDSECRDISYIHKNIQMTLGVIYGNKLSNGQQMYCKQFYYGLHILQHEMEQLGHTCVLNDLFHEMATELVTHGIDRSALTACNDVMKLTPSAFCTDQSAVFQIIANDPSCQTNIRNIISYPTTCSFRDAYVACAERRLHFAGLDCDIKSIFTASKITEYMKANNPTVTFAACS